MAVPQGPALRIRDLSVRYGGRAALHDVSLSVDPGELVALTGPNGSGKTTLLRAVLGFLEPDRGTVELYGRPTSTLSVLERARQVAWVPQAESPRDNVRLYDYVLYGRYPFHGPLDAESAMDHAIAHRVLDDAGLLDRAEDGILTLSGGERQRAILARALAQTTPILLLDEPTTHLDIGHQLDLLGRVRSLARSRRVAVVAALHDLNLASRFADRIVVLSRGRCVADGPPAAVISAELLAQVWGVVADLERDRRTGLPYLVPRQLSVDRPTEVFPPLLGPVHVVGGGGAAAPFLHALAEEGYRLTAGALHLLDSDAESATALAVPTALESPFAPLSDRVRERHRVLLGSARAIVVAPFAVGPSNLANLEDLVPFAARTPMFLLEQPPIGGRDFSGGRATEIYAELIRRGATAVPDLTTLMPRLHAVLAPAISGSAGTVTRTQR